MGNGSGLTITGEELDSGANSTSSGNSLTSSNSENSDTGQNLQAAESLLTMEIYDANSLLRKLQLRGVNPLRPEILAIIEFLPLAINDQNLNSSFSNINFGSDSIQNNITSAANFAEIQRVLKDMNYSAVVSLIEKESGMKLDLMKSIIDLFVLILNRTASESLNSIFLAGSNVDDAAQLLVSQYFSDNLILNSSNDITQKESIIINNQIFFRNERLSINNKLNFLDDLETVRLRQFLETNVSNPRILLLARCAILSAISSGVIRHLKSNTSFVDDFIRAVSFVEVVNPDLEMSNSITKYGSFIKDQSYDLSENPLGKIGIATTDSDSDNHSLSMSNNFIFLNIIGGLVCEMLFFNDKDETLPENLININSILNKNFIRIGRSEEFYNAIVDLSSLTHLQILNNGNTFSGNIDDISSSLTENIKNYSDELFSFCIFNEVVGDNVFIKGKDIVSNFKNYINVSQNIIQNDAKEKLLSQFIHQILLKFSSTGSGYPDYTEKINLGSVILNFLDVEGLVVENSLGLLANRYVSYRNEKNGVNSIETGNKYLPLETSKGIYDFDLSQETANLIPVEDAFFNNNINNEAFNSANADAIFLDATTFSLLYNDDIKKLLEDVTGLFGLGYELDEGTIQNVAEDSKNNKIEVPGVTPANYLNYYLEGIAKDLEGFLTSLQSFITSEGSDFLGQRPHRKDGSDRSHVKVRGQILSLAMILNAESDSDFLNLFRGFYFCDRTIKNHLKLPKLNLGSSNSSFDDEDLSKQYQQNATAGTDYCFGRLFEALDHKGNIKKKARTFTSGDGTWDSYIYNASSGIGATNIYDVQDGLNEKEGKVFGFDNNQNILLENSTTEISYIIATGTKGPHLYIRSAMAYGFSSYGEDYSRDNQKACIQLGGSFYQRLINTPILYTKVNDHSGTADGDCSNAINAGGLTKSNYKDNRFTNARYYDENGNNGLQELAGSDKFEYGGISNITHLQKCYAIFVWYVKFLKNTIGIKIKTESISNGSFYPDDKLSLVFSTNQILGVIYALRGVSRENLNTQAQQFNISSADPTGIDIDLITQSYDNAMEHLSGVRSAIKRKKQQMLTKLNILAHNALDIQKETQDIINLIKNPQTLQGYEGYINKFFKDYSKNFTLSRDAIGNSTKYYYDHLNYSAESFPYSNYDKKQLNEFKRMYQTLSSKGYNLLENEKRGRKNILNIGIPSGLVDTLSQQAFSKSGDNHYLDSTLVAIYLHRTNELTEEEEVYPRPFVFDTAKYISNINTSENSNLLIPEFLKINELEEGKFNNNQNLLSIIENTKFLMSDRNRPDDQKLNFIDNGYGKQSMNYSLIDGITTEGNNYNDHFIKDVCINHVFDNTLKIYQNLLLNLEMENYNFLLDENAVHAGSLDNSEYVASCRESFKNFLLAYYPSFNVDPLTKNKVAQALSNYDNLFFNSTEEKIKQVVGGFVFDRVFSIPYSDRDFILKTQDYEGLYGSKIPLVKISSEQQIIDVLNYNNDNDIVAKNYSIKIKDNNVGTIYKFFATINILKRW